MFEQCGKLLVPYSAQTLIEKAASLDARPECKTPPYRGAVAREARRRSGERLVSTIGMVSIGSPVVGHGMR